jgi:hypothetical protein
MQSTLLILYYLLNLRLNRDYIKILPFYKDTARESFHRLYLGNSHGVNLRKERETPLVKERRKEIKKNYPIAFIFLIFLPSPVSPI